MNDLLLAFGVEIYPTNRSLDLVEADVIEPLKTSTANRPHSVIWNEEMFLPSHEYVLSLCQLWDMEMAFLCLAMKWSEG